MQLAVLCDPKLPRTAKRTYLSLALFRSGLGYSRASVRTLAATSGLDRSSIQRGLRELENRFHITRRGTTARGVERYFLVETPPVAPKSGAKNTPASTEGYSPNPQNGQKRGPPQGREPDKNAAPQGREPDKNAAPKRTKTRPLLQEHQESYCHERRKAPALADTPAPCDEQPPPMTKKDASAIIARFRMKAPGSDFGKDCLQEGQQERAADLTADWTGKDFEAAKRSAEASLGGADATEQRTLRAQIKEFSDQIKKPGDFCPADFGLVFA